MRAVSVVCACLLTACSTQTVRCERHLAPINIPKQPVADAPAPGQAGGVSTNTRGGRKSDAMPETKAGAGSAVSKEPTAPTHAGGPP